MEEEAKEVLGNLKDTKVQVEATVVELKIGTSKGIHLSRKTIEVPLRNYLKILEIRQDLVEEEGLLHQLKKVEHPIKIKDKMVLKVVEVVVQEDINLVVKS